MQAFPLLRRLLVLAPTFLLFHTGFSQRYVYNRTNLDAEEKFFQSDPAVSKNKKKIKKTYYCFDGASDSCYLEQITVHDDSGRIVELTEWEYPENKGFALNAKFTWISTYQIDAIL